LRTQKKDTTPIRVKSNNLVNILGVRKRKVESKKTWEGRDRLSKRRFPYTEKENGLSRDHTGRGGPQGVPSSQIRVFWGGRERRMGSFPYGKGGTENTAKKSSSSVVILRIRKKGRKNNAAWG